MFQYTPDFLPSKIAVVGAGGTGSRLIAPLAQMLKNAPWANGIIRPQITIIDDDVVEQKNLIRQNFIEPDVGRNKASVLAQRYSRAFDIDIRAREERVTGTTPGSSSNNLGPLAYLVLHENYHVVVSCVDSLEARFNIIKEAGIQGPENCLIIDAGNENDFGQVSVYSTHPLAPLPSLHSFQALNSIRSPHTSRAINRDLPGLEEESFPEISHKHLADEYKTYMEGMPRMDSYVIDLPFIPLVPEDFIGRVESEISCADLDQTLAVNNLMASALLSVLQNIVLSIPLRTQTTYYSLDGGHHSAPLGKAYVDKTLPSLQYSAAFNAEEAQSLDPQISSFYEAIQKEGDSPSFYRHPNSKNSFFHYPRKVDFQAHVAKNVHTQGDELLKAYRRLSFYDQYLISRLGQEVFNILCEYYDPDTTDKPEEMRVIPETEFIQLLEVAPMRGLISLYPKRAATLLLENYKLDFDYNVHGNEAGYNDLIQYLICNHKEYADEVKAELESMWIDAGGRSINRGWNPGWPTGVERLKQAREDCGLFSFSTDIVANRWRLDSEGHNILDGVSAADFLINHHFLESAGQSIIRDEGFDLWKEALERASLQESVPA